MTRGHINFQASNVGRPARQRRALRGPALLLGLTVALLWGGLADGATAKEKVEIKITAIDPKAAAKVSYARDIQPILINDCVECHSTEDRKSGLDVTSVAALKKGGKKAGPAILPGKPDESPMVKYIRGLAEGPQMPKGEPALSQEELHLIRCWIAAGAVDDSAQLAASAASPKAPGTGASTLTPAATQEILGAFVFGDRAGQLNARRRLRLGLLPPAPAPPAVSGPVFNAIDQFVAAQWQRAKLPQATNPPPVCDDAAFVRRVYLDVIGVIPSAEAGRKFVEDTSPDKRAKLVDELMARKKEYAENWTPFWEEALASQVSVGGVATHGNYSDFIYDSFFENKPYDLMVAQLLDPTSPDHKKSTTQDANGKKIQIGFIRNDTHQVTLQTAANTAQVFLGTGMKCASCHSHFLNKEWPQARFLAFAGLFASNNLELIRCEKKSGQFIAAAFPFELPGMPKTVPKDTDDRLHYLTMLLIDPANPRFARTIVNRLWKRYLGLGLFEPADDFRLDRPASDPALLDWLADDFMRHDYDLKHTIRLILTSRTYQLRYDPALEDHFNVQKPGEPRYARSPSLRRLTAEQFIYSINEATAKDWDGRRLFRQVASTALTRALGRPAARNEISTGRADDVAVVQSLELLNGGELYKFVYDGEILGQLATEPDRRKVVNELYWALLNRAPAKPELELALSYLRNSSGPAEPVVIGPPSPSATAPLGDMLWALVVCPEFQFIR